MSNDVVLIPKSRLIDLLQNEEKLYRLEYYGVDNWEGYSIALRANLEEDMTSLREKNTDIIIQINQLPEGSLFCG